MDIEVLKSVGIDIGTSTSKFIVSELTIGRVSSRFALPHFDIINRKVTYVSNLISTPLKTEEEIDLFRLVDWLEKEYSKAGLSLSEIKSGAVIITGETAIKKNADALIHYLAERSGDFVVAIAGASLEGILAGRGSGAFLHSQKSKGVIANIDIGGGTANVVLFQQGKVLETITFHLGGRLIEINVSGEVLSISPSLRKWLTERYFQFEKGSLLTISDLNKICAALSQDMLDVLAGRRTISSLKKLVHSASCEILPEIDEIMFSGGVGRLLNETAPTDLEEAAAYQDIGPILANQLMQLVKEYHFKMIEAVQTSRATVIGAGMQSTKLSGSTISLQPDRLPLRNIPVLKQTITDIDFEQQIETIFLKGSRLFQNNDPLPFAVGLEVVPFLSYTRVKELAQVIGKWFVHYFPHAEILVVVCVNDMAKALGQALQLQYDLDVICIDQVILEHGDYIDIGEPLNDMMVPVVVKTLAFS